MALKLIEFLQAATIAELNAAEVAGIAPHDAIISVEEDNSIRKWDAVSQTWTRRGGPVIPIPMSQLSAPLKAQSDAITQTGYATAAQGALASTALQSSGEQFSVPFLPGVNTFTKMPMADTELPNTDYRDILDLTAFNSFRVTCQVVLAGFASANLRFQYSPTNSIFTDLSSLGSLAIATIGPRDTGWLALPLGARLGSVYLRLMGKAGDGKVNPQISQLTLSFKA